MDAFFLDGDTDALEPAPRRALVASALRDLQSRYSGGGNRALLLVRGPGGAVLGCAGVEPQPFLGNAVLRGTRRASPPLGAVLRPVVSNLAVARRARGRGLARALMRAAEAAAAAWGFDECLLLVDRGNARARRLYAGLGYRPLKGGEESATTLRVAAGRVDEAPVVNVCLRKSLRPLPWRWVDNADPARVGAPLGVGLAAALLAAAAPQQAATALALLQDTLGSALALLPVW